MNSKTHTPATSNRLRSPNAALRWSLIIILVGVITLVYAAVGHYSSQTSNPAEPASPPLAELTRYFFDSYSIGYLVQVNAVPVFLIYLFSQTQLFWRIFSQETQPGDKFRLLCVLVGIQSLTLSYEFGMTHFGNDPASFGLLVAIFAGLLGGWRYGLAMGMIVMFFRGTHDMLGSWTITGQDWHIATQSTFWGHALLWNYRNNGTGA